MKAVHSLILRTIMIDLDMNLNVILKHNRFRYDN